MTKILMFQTNSPLRNEYFLGCFEHLSIRISDLFRVSPVLVLKRGYSNFGFNPLNRKISLSP